MNLSCRLGRHRLSPGQIWNHGYVFSFCVRCGCDMVRPVDGEWRRVRPPLKVVWRERHRFDSPWISVMPEVDARLPIAPEWRSIIARGQRPSKREPRPVVDRGDVPPASLAAPLMTGYTPEMQTAAE